MLHRAGPPPRAATAAVAVLTVLAAGACGASLPTSSETDAAETADAVCALLRDWNNEMGDIINATSKSITDDDDPSTANDVLAEGFEQLIEVAEARRSQLDELDLPDVADRQALLDDLRAGADESIAVLEAELDDVADLEPITVERQGGALGGAFVAVEGALSVIEPEVAGYGTELRTAFAEEEGCRHVVQPT
ncbi:MAG TPA: hypothetical protein VFZ77_18110 [Acidimicrobiales bacterium]